jgi:hypothetical protein
MLLVAPNGHLATGLHLKIFRDSRFLFLFLFLFLFFGGSF